MNKILKTNNDTASFSQIPGVSFVENFRMHDNRGNFRKIYYHQQLQNKGIFSEMKECFISVSQKNVIRGMHFQLPPFACGKLVSILHGSAIDVICDLRKGSPCYLETRSVFIDSSTPFSLYIPCGCAHGFLALEDNTTVLYNTTVEFNSAADAGIYYRSIDYIWPIDDGDVIISERDKKLPKLDKFESPFYLSEGKN